MMNYALLFVSSMGLACPVPAKAQSFSNPVLSSHGHISPSQLYQVRHGRMEAEAGTANRTDCLTNEAKCQKSVTSGGEFATVGSLVRGLASYEGATYYESKKITLRNGGTAEAQTIGGRTASSFNLSKMFSLGLALDFKSKSFLLRSEKEKAKSLSSDVQPTYGATFRAAGIELTASEKVGLSKGAKSLREPGEKRFLLQVRPMSSLALGVRYDMQSYGNVETNLSSATNLEWLATIFFSGASLEGGFKKSWNFEGVKGVHGRAAYFNGLINIANDMAVGASYEEVSAFSDLSDRESTRWSLNILLAL